MKLRAALCATLILLCVSRSHLPPAYASGSADEAWLAATAKELATLTW